MLLTVAEAAVKLRISESLTYQLCAKNLLRHSRVGCGRGVIRITLEAIEEYLTGHEQKAQTRTLSSPVFTHRRPS